MAAGKRWVTLQTITMLLAGAALLLRNILPGLSTQVVLQGVSQCHALLCCTGAAQDPQASYTVQLRAGTRTRAARALGRSAEEVLRSSLTSS